MRYEGLAKAVAARLAGVLPPGAAVDEEPEGFLRLSAGGGRREAFPLDEPEVEEEIDPATYDPPYPAFAVLEALDFVQEYVRDELGVELDDPWAEQAGDEIRLGFGGQALEPIRL